MSLITYNSTINTTQKKNRKMEFIVVHYTAGTTSSKNSALNNAKFFSKETTKASSDYIIDDEDVVQYNCDIKNRYTWHCGGSKLKGLGGSFYKTCTNANSIGVELCSTSKSGKVENPNSDSWYFTEKVLESATNLIASLMRSYNIPIENVIRHYDVTSKLCPGILGWNDDSSKWNEFKNNLNIRYKDYEIAILKTENNILRYKLDSIKQVVSE